MQITELKVPIRSLVEDYMNDDVEGVVGYANNLDIRPKYQREFVYKDAQRNEVIRTVKRGLPLNVMYWVDRGEQYEDDPETPRYEVMDGQQRTISICEYAAGTFAVDDMYFHSLPKDAQDAFLSYELFVYVCSGTHSEKLEWFRTINIAGEKLTDQELRNATHAGPWVSDAKRYFSKPGGPAYQVADDYLKGFAIRQEYLETAIRWALDAEGGYGSADDPVDLYMSRHQEEPTANVLWSYFRSVIDWVQAIFPTYRKEMKGIAWGILYNANRDRADLDPQRLEAEVSLLMSDDDVTRKAGVYEYLLGGKESCLSIRAFDKRMKREAYERQGGICPFCEKHFEISEMQADHIKPWAKGGPTTAENCQMLCADCNRTKSDK